MPFKNLHLVPANESDKDFVNELVRSTMKVYVEATWSDLARRESYYTGNGFKKENTRIAYLGDKRVGRLSLKFRDGGMFLDNMHVVPEFQGKGVGTWMIEQVISEAVLAKCSLRVSVLQNNPAKRLYERMGFKVYGEARDRWLLEFLV